MTNKKFDQIYMACMRELYENAEHISGKRGNFDELVANTTVDEKGKKWIPFDEYYIDYDKFNEIFEKHCGLRVKGVNRHVRNGFSMHIYLGASPTSSRENWEKLKKDRGY